MIVGVVLFATAFNLVVVVFVGSFVVVVECCGWLTGFDLGRTLLMRSEMPPFHGAGISAGFFEMVDGVTGDFVVVLKVVFEVVFVVKIGSTVVIVKGGVV